MAGASGYGATGAWLVRFLSARVRRAAPGVGVHLERASEGSVRGFSVRLRYRGRLGAASFWAWRDVEGGRGNLAWCRRLAERFCREAEAAERCGRLPETGAGR